MARIGISGFQHETNTFAPLSADLQAFATVAAYPRLPRGEALIEETQGLNLPIAGFIAAAKADAHQLFSGVWGMATPSAQVTDDAFETISGWIIDDLRAALPLDAVYLCLHGAMVTESFEDGEGELLRRVREVVGENVPLVVSLDLHCNTTEAMMHHADAMVAYRTYPHVDMAETGANAYQLLQRMLRSGRRPAKAFRKTDFLISLVWQCSLIAPADRIYASLSQPMSASLWSASFTPGFPPADIAECGPAVFAYADSQEEADGVVDELLAQVVGARSEWNGRLYTPDEALDEAMRGFSGRPYVLADTQDNPGAGGAGDTVGLLEAMVRCRAEDTVLAMLYDPQAALAAHQGGVGAELSLALGAKSGQAGHEPFAALFTVDALSDGEFVGTGPMNLGGQFRMGPTASLKIGGVRVLVTSAITQAKDQSMLRHIGIDPTQQKIVGLKSSVHFRAHFQALADAVLVVEAPGPNIADHLKMDYRNLREGVWLTPTGPAFALPAI